MSISVSRESISKLMTELVDQFPMESEGRSSISDFGKLLFAEGQSATTTTSKGNEMNGSGTTSLNSLHTPKDGKPNATTPSGLGTKRVYTEIKGVPRQKAHDVRCVVTENGKIALSQSSMRKMMKSKEKATPNRWSPEEDEKLREAVSRHGERNWKSIAEEVVGRNHTQCLQRWTKVLAPGLVKGHWQPEEDDLLKELVAEGRKNWGQVATRIPGRTSKQCRERWYNHLDPSIVRGEYSADEDRIILEAQARLGNRWSAIAAMLPGRTEDAVKIRWKSLCRVRKGQVRRGQDRGKPGARPMLSSPMGLMPPMMNPQHMPYGDGMIKTEDVGPYMMQPTPMSGGIATPIHHHPQLMYPQQSMMYSQQTQGQDMNGYHNGMYAKQHMSMPSNPYNMQPVMQQPQSIPFKIDSRANAVNLQSSGMTTSTGYPQSGYNGVSPVSPYTNANVNNTGYNVSYQQQMTQPPSMYSNGMMPLPQQNYAYNQVSTSTDVSHAGMANSASNHHPIQQHPHQDSLNSTSNTNQTPKIHHQTTQNPSPSAEKTARSPGTKTNKSGNPVMAFLQQQQKAKENGGSSSRTGTIPGPMTPSPVNAASTNNTNSQLPFNPAAAFAQRLQTPKPPIAPRSSDDEGGEIEKDSRDHPRASIGSAKEPVLKKVKPRSSIDAARASAARRMRTSGSGTSLSGRPSLDNFLNEIGDVGRVSDLKMDDFQSLEGLWRVSDDMNRLSL